jgi:hypothetical protein
LGTGHKRSIQEDKKEKNSNVLVYYTKINPERQIGKIAMFEDIAYIFALK